MAETAITLRPGDSRLTSELTGDERILGGGAMWQTLFSSFADLPAATIWQYMLQDSTLALDEYRLMEERDTPYGPLLDTRKEAVLSREWRIVPASDEARDVEIADFVREQFEQSWQFSQTLREILDCLGMGVSIGETIYARDGGRLVISEIKFRNAKAFTFGEPGRPQNGELRLRYGSTSLGGEILPWNKFVVASFQPKLGNRWGSPLARRCFWMSWFLRNTERLWLRSLEKSNGTILTKYPDGSPDAIVDKALEVSKAIAEETAVAGPASLVAEMLEKARSASGPQFEAFANDLAAKQIALIVLGQTLTSSGSDSGSGSRALGEVHNDVRAEKRVADAELLMNTVDQQIIRPLVDFNYGEDVEIPKLVIDAGDEENLNEAVTRDKMLFDMGFPFGRKYVEEKYKVSGVEEGGEDELLVGRGAGSGERGAGEPTDPDTEDDAEFAEGEEFPAGDPEPLILAGSGVKAAREIYAGFLQSAFRAAEKAFPEGDAE